MTSRATTGARKGRRLAILREADDRVFDPSTIEAQLTGLTDDHKSALLDTYRSTGRILSAAEAAQKRELLALFKRATQDIEAEIYNVFSSMGQEQWSLAAVRRIGRDQVLLDQINNRITALGGQVTSTLQDGLLDQFKKAWAGAAYQLDAMTPPSTSIRFGIIPDRDIIAMLNQPFDGARFSDRLGLITDDMAHKVQQQLTYSMIAEETWQDAAKRIQDEMGTEGQRAVWRAEMIARTEMSRASSLAAEAFHAENEDVIEKVVVVAHPASCDECLDLHGENVDDVGYPPFHPNCRCGTIAVPTSWGDLATPNDPADFSLLPQSRADWMKDKQLEV